MGRTNVWEECVGSDELRGAFLGASITDGYLANISYCSCLERYMNEERERRSLPAMQTKVLASPGTTSMWGMFCLEALLEVRPRFVFLEYSVNDYKDAKHREAYEGMVRRCLRAGALPVVLILTSQYEYSCRGHMTRIARHYGVPVIDAGETLFREIGAGRIGWQQYSGDYIHPNDWGQQFIAECCVDGLKQVDMPCIEEAARRPALFGARYEHFHIQKCTELNVENPVFEAEFTGDELLVAYKCTNESWAGMMEVRVDGRYVSRIDSCDFTAWGNPVVESYSIEANESNSRRVTLTYVRRRESERVRVFYIGYIGELQVP